MSRSTFQPASAPVRFTLEQVYPDVRPDEFERHTFHVQSRSEGRGNYKVYLDAYDWNGACNCQHFEFRMRPELERFAMPSDGLRCWHIKKARSYYLDELGRAMSKLVK